MRWLPRGHGIALNRPGRTWYWQVKADGIPVISGEANSERQARAAARLALRIAAYNTRELCSTRRGSHYYQPGQTPDADTNVLTWCGKRLWLGGSGHDSRYPVCRRCRQIERDIEEEDEQAGRIIVNGRIL